MRTRRGRRGSLRSSTAIRAAEEPSAVQRVVPAPTETWRAGPGRRVRWMITGSVEVDGDDLVAAGVGDVGELPSRVHGRVAGLTQPADYGAHGQRRGVEDAHRADRCVCDDDVPERRALDAARRLERADPLQDAPACDVEGDDVRLEVGGGERDDRATRRRTERAHRARGRGRRARRERCRGSSVYSCTSYVPRARGGPGTAMSDLKWTNKDVRAPSAPRAGRTSGMDLSAVVRSYGPAVARAGRDERAWVRGAQRGSVPDMEALFDEHWPRAHGRPTWSSRMPRSPRTWPRSPSSPRSGASTASTAAGLRALAPPDRREPRDRRGAGPEPPQRDGADRSTRRARKSTSRQTASVLAGARHGFRPTSGP